MCVCVCVCVLTLIHPFVYECVHEWVCVSTLNIRTYDTVCYVYGYLCRVMYSVVLTCSHSIRVLAVPSCSAQCHVLHIKTFDVTLHTGVNVRMCNTYIRMCENISMYVYGYVYGLPMGTHIF